MSKNHYSIDFLKDLLEKEQGFPLSVANTEMLKLAYRGHDGQFRYSIKVDQHIPYIVHPVGVAILVIRYFDKVKKYLKDDLERLIMVALAHDLLEDTNILRDQITEIGGERVTRLVESMTKLPNSSKDLKERNQGIRNRTITAGPSALYVRICDNIHNLSRQFTTPIHLLQTAVSRADDLYLPLFEKIKIGDDIRKIYELKVNEIKKYLENSISIEPKILEIPKTIDQAINLCSTFTHQKLLKIHNIVDKLRDVTGAISVSIWAQHGKVEKFYRLSFLSGLEKEFNDNIKEGWLNLTTKEIEKAEIKKFVRNSTSTERYFSLMLPINSKFKYLIILIFKKNSIPNWATPVNLEFLVKSLSERFILANSNYKRELISIASSLGMSFEVDWADQLAIEPSNLIELNSWQKRCAQAVRQIRHICEVFLEQESAYSPMKDLIKIESRVKGTTSIIRKFLPPTELEWPKFENLLDIAGVRVICPTKKWADNIKKYLLSSKTNSLSKKSNLYREVRDYTKKPTFEGYRALHIILSVDTFYDKKKVTVPCEIQIQTMIQDVWAKMAHRMSYKQDSRSEMMRKKFQNISNKLEEFDNLANKIIDF